MATHRSDTTEERERMRQAAGNDWEVRCGVKAIALLGDFDPAFAPHVATGAAIAHSAAALGIEVESAWVSSQDIEPSLFSRFSGLWVAPGGLHQDVGNALWAIQSARECGIPCLGTCGGFQHMILEYARNVLGVRDAQHAKYDADGANLFITPLACSLAGRTMQLSFVEGSRIARMYGALSASEDYYCSFGINPDKASQLRDGPLQISGSDAEGEIRVVELPAHPFFVGTLFVPQARSAEGRPHPVVNAFLRAVANA